MSPEMVSFYKAYEAYEKKDTLEAATTATSWFIKAHQPKLNFIKEDVASGICYRYYDFRNSDVAYFIKRMKDVDLPSDCRKKLEYIWGSYRNDKLDITLDWIYNSSLYNRSYEDFKYTTNVFNLLGSEETVGSYFKDTSVVDFSRLYESDGKIKPAGLDREYGDTIFNLIEEWAKDNEV